MTSLINVEGRKSGLFLSEAIAQNWILNKNRVCHGFGLMKEDHYFRVTFDHFGSECHFQRQLGEVEKTGLNFYANYF